MKQVKEFLIDITIVVVVCAIYYLCFAFVAAKTNPFEWSQEARFCITFLAAPSCVFVIAARRIG